MNCCCSTQWHFLKIRIVTKKPVGSKLTVLINTTFRRIKSCSNWKRIVKRITRIFLKEVTLHYCLTRFSGPRCTFLNFFILLHQVYGPPYSPFFTSLASLVFCLFYSTTHHPHFSSHLPRRNTQVRQFRRTTQAVACCGLSMFPCVLWYFFHFSNNILSLSGGFEDSVEASSSLSGFQVRHRCVDRITSIDKCSQTQLLIFVLLRSVST